MTSYQPEYIDDKKPSLFEKFIYPYSKPADKKLKNSVEGKTILITGASFGIGALLAEKLAGYSCTLLLIARTGEKLKEIKERFKEQPCIIHYFPADLRDESQVNILSEELHRQNFSIDIYINNAGKSIYRRLEDSLGRHQDITRTVATNYTGAAILLLDLIPVLLKQKGQIINISAINVLLPPTAGWSAYQSSKVAFDQWLKCLEPELKARQVRVSHIYLPVVRTRMSMVNEKNHRKVSMSKESAVNIILRTIISGRRKYRPWWTGFIQFMNFIFPNLWYRLQVRHHRKKKT